MILTNLEHLNEVIWILIFCNFSLTMEKKYFFGIIVVFITLNFCEANKCIQEGPCVCKFDEYTYINLTDLIPSKHQFIEDRVGNISYFFAGCKNEKFNPQDYNMNAPETDGSLIKCLEIIQIINNNTSIIYNCSEIGFSNEIIYELAANSTNDYQIVYNVKSAQSFPSIHLVCDSYSRTDLKILNYNSDALTLYSPLVCVKHISHHELSTGSIFCILFFTAAFIYFVGGAIIMYTARGARGVEIIPNYDTWVSLPGLIRDGMVYLLSGCRPFTVSTAETYDRI